MSDAVMRSQSYAVEIEHIMRSVFGCDRYGVGGIVNSDYIRKQPVGAMIHTITFIYANADSDKKHELEKFISDVYYYKDWNIDTILSFETSEKEFDNGTYTLEFENGEKALTNIINEFRKVVK